MVQRCCEFVEEMEKDPALAESRLALVDCLRTQTNGKIYVEVERARLTLKLAQLKESKGNTKIEITSKSTWPQVVMTPNHHDLEVDLKSITLKLKSDFRRHQWGSGYVDWAPGWDLRFHGPKGKGKLHSGANAADNCE